MAEKSEPSPIVLKGIPASPGIAMGKAFVLQEEQLTYVFRQLSKNEVKKEIHRFQRAIVKTKADLSVTREKVLKVLGKSHARLIDVHLLILEDALFTTDVEKKIAHEHMNAEAALVATLDHMARAFESLEDPYFRERKDDLMDVGKRIMRHLLGHGGLKLSQLRQRSIVIAHDLTPTETVSMRVEWVEGFATDIGGRTSHAAILAQGLEIPAVVGLKEVTLHVKAGDRLIVDGNEGVVLVNPSATTVESYRRVREIQRAEVRELEKLRDLPAQTLDRRRVVLAANIETSEEVKSVLHHGAEGIGLYRTEFLYLNRSTLPSEEEHYQNYRTVARQMLPYPVIIRTVDLGGDKLAPLGVSGISAETNPFLGLRGIRLCVKFPGLFKTQLRAILRASTEGKLKIMYPMISSLDELAQASRMLHETQEELRRDGIPFDEQVEVGVMIEVPSAAITADLFAQQADFLSLGTNDLIQYTLAVDRVNENVAPLYDPVHLAILRLLRLVIDAGHKAGRWVGICGEMAGDTAFTKVLLGLGLDEFSVPPAAVPRIKKLIRSIRFEEAKDLAREILGMTDHTAVMKKLSREKA